MIIEPLRKSKGSFFEGDYMKKVLFILIGVICSLNLVFAKSTQNQSTDSIIEDKEESNVVVKVDTHLDKKKVHKGEELIFSIIIEQSGGGDPYLYELDEPEFSGLELIKQYSKDTIFTDRRFKRELQKKRLIK